MLERRTGMTTTEKTSKAAQRIIALHGWPGVGKDTMADMLVARQGYTKLAFADPVYLTVARLFGIGPLEARERYNKVQAQDRFAVFHVQDAAYRDYLYRHLKQDLYEPRTIRYHMERYGTDYCRHVGDQLRWVHATMRALSMIDTDVVIPDLRNYRDAREYNALMRLAADGAARVCVVHLLRAVPPPDPHEANSVLPRTYIDVQILAEDGNEEGTYAELLSCVQDFLGS